MNYGIWHALRTVAVIGTVTLSFIAIFPHGVLALLGRWFARTCPALRWGSGRFWRGVNSS